MSISASAAAALTVSGVTTPVVVADTPANVATYLDALEALAVDSKLASLTLLGSGTQTLAIPASAIVTDAQALLLVTNSSWSISPSGTLTAAQAATASSTLLAKLTAGLAVSDTAADVVSNLAGLQAHAPWIATITLTGTSNLALTAAALSADASALLKVAGTYTITVSSTATVAQVEAANTTLLGKLSSGMVISDTAANLAAGLGSLFPRNSGIASITLTDTTPVLSITATQLVNDAALLAKISGSYTISVTGSATAAQAASVRNALIVHVNPGLAVVDSAANVVSSLAGLQAHASWINSITLTDTTLVLSLTAQQFVTDTAALLKVVGSYGITVTTDATAQQAAAVNASLATRLSAGLVVQDSAADVAASIDAMQARTGAIASITLTDITPVLSITVTQLTNDATTLLKIGGSYSISVTGTATAQQVANLRTTLGAKLNAPLVVSDSAANVTTYLSGLQAHATSIASITLTDTTPVLSISATQLVTDAAALLKIGGSYRISLSGSATVAQVDGANATLVAKLSAGFAVLDSAADVSTAIDTLQAHANSVASISLTDATPVLSITATQLVNDTNILLKIGGSYTIAVTGTATAQQAAAVRGSLMVKLSAPLVVSDASANVVGNLAGLQAHASYIASIALTDTDPTLSLTAAQVAADAAALSKITSPYLLDVTSTATTQQLASIPAALLQHLAGDLAISDSAANVAASLPLLQQDAGWISSIALTDDQPVLSITAQQMLASPDALAEITGTYGLTVASGTFTAAQVLGLNDLVTANLTAGVVVEDSAANVDGDLDMLQALGATVGSIILTDVSPSITITGTQLQSDSATLQKIASVTLILSGPVTAAQAASVVPALKAELSSALAVSDTAENVVANLNGLQALGQSLASITLTDGGTPTLTVDAATLAQDAGALALIGGTWTLAVTGGVTAEQAVGLSPTVLSHISGGVAVSDTASGVQGSLDGLQAMGSNLSTITVTGLSPVLTVSAEQLISDSGALLKLAAGCGLLVSGPVSVAQALVADPTLTALLTTGLTVSDAAATIADNLTALQALGTVVASVTLADSPNVLSITAAQLVAYGALLAKLSGTDNITVTNTATAAQAAGASLTVLGKLTAGLAVSDTAANVATFLDGLQAQGSGVASIDLSDSTTLSVTSAQLANDADAIGKIDDLTAITVTDNPTVADLVAAGGLLALTSGLAVVDTAGDVAAGLATLLAANAQIASIQLSGVTTLSLTTAQLVNDAVVLIKISNLSAITVTDNPTVADLAAAATSGLLVLTGGLVVIDTAANILGGFATLLAANAQIASIQLSDTTTLSLTSAQLSADATVLAKISNLSAITITDNPTVADLAAAGGLLGLTSGLAVIDTAAHISGGMDTLLSAYSHIATVQLSDGTTLSVTTAELLSDAAVLEKISNLTGITISDNPTVADLAEANPGLLALTSNLAVSDTASNIAGGLTTLLGLTSQIASITLSDVTTLSITTAQLIADAAVLEEINNLTTITVTDNPTVAQLLDVSPALLALTADLMVADTATDILAGFPTLLTLNSHIASIQLSDTTTLSLTSAQLSADAAVLAKISNLSAITITDNPTVADLAAAGGLLALTSGLAVIDTAAHVSGGMATLLSAYSHIATVQLSDGTTLSVTTAELLSDAAVLEKISNLTGITISDNPTVADLAEANPGLLALTSNLAVSDTASNIAGGLTTLLGLTSQIASITLSDVTTLSITTAQLIADAAVLEEISNLGTIIITDSPTVAELSGANQALVAKTASLTITDTAADIATGLPTLLTLNSHIASIHLSDVTALNITTAQLTGDSVVLDKIDNLSALTISDNPAVADLISADPTLLAKTGSLAVADTAADIVGGFTTLLSLNSHIASIRLTDTTTLSLTTSQLLNDAAVLDKISNLATITISDNPSVSALASADPTLLAKTSNLAVVDTATDVVAGFSTLLGLSTHIASIQLSDVSTISIATAQLTTDAAVLTEITNLTAITISDNPTVAGLASANPTLLALTSNLAVVDTAADVAGGLSTLLGLSTHIASIHLSDVNTISIAGTQLTADAAVLTKINNLAAITINGTINIATLAAANAGLLAMTSNLAVADTAADIAAGLGTLVADDSHISSITLTDAPPAVLSITAAQLVTDSAVLLQITGSYSISISSGTLTAAQALGISPSLLAHMTGALPILDSASNIIGALTSLEAIHTSIGAVTFTDTPSPILSLTPASMIAAIAVLNLASGCSISISGTFTAAQAASIAGTAAASLLATGAVVSDSAADVSTNIDALETLAAVGLLGSVTLSDTTPVVSVSPTQLLNDAAALRLISNASYTLSISSPLTAQQAASVNSLLISKLPANLAVQDSSTNVIAYLDQLETLALGGHLGSIALTDGGTPILHVTAGQVASDAAALAAITGSYQLQISGGITAAQAAAYAGTPAELHTGVSVVDSAANVATNLASLQTLAAAGKLTLISFTDGGTPTLSLGGPQFASGLTALATVVGSYSVTLTTAMSIQQLENVNTAGLLSKVSGTVAISDTSTNVVNDLSILESLVSNIGTISLSDNATNLTILTAQLSADAAALKKVQGLSTITLSDTPTVAQVTGADSTLKAKLTALTISDAATAVSTNLDALQAMQSQITSIALSGGATTLAVTTEELDNDYQALNKVTGLTSITVTDTPTVANVTGANATVLAKLTGLNIVDSSTNVVGALNTLEAMAGQINSIAFNPAVTTITIATAQLSSDATILEKITGLTTIALSDSPTVANVINAAPTLQAMLTGLAISDSATDVVGGLNTLEGLAPQISSIALTGGVTTLNIASSQLGSDAAVLKKVQGLATITLSDSPTVAEITGADSALKAMLSGIAITDAATTVSTNLNALQAMQSQIASITLSGNATTLAVTTAQMVSDYQVLNKVTGLTSITVSDNPTVSQVTSANATVLAKLTGLNIIDSSTNVVGALNTLEAMAGQINSIAFSNGVTAINIATAQLSSDATILKKITGLTTIALSDNPTVANVINADPTLLPKLSSLAISDSATSVLAGLDTLEGLAPQISSIALTGGVTTLSIASAQLGNDAAVLEKVQGLATITLSDNPTVAEVTGANSTLQAKLTGLTISDTASAVVAGLNALETVQASITSIALSGGVTTLAVTTAQMVSDYQVLDKITGLTTITISDNPSVSQLINANATVQGKLTGLDIVDSAANVTTSLDALETLHAKINSITLNDATTPTITISAASLTSDSDALALIGGSYALTINSAGTSAAAAATVPVAVLSHLSAGLALNVTSADLNASLDNLAPLASYLGTITLTDNSPVISIASTQLVNDAAVLNNISTPYTLTVSGAITAQQFYDLPANVVAALASNGGVAINDTTANIQNPTYLDVLEENSTAVASTTVSDNGPLILTGATFQQDWDAIRFATDSSGNPLDPVLLTISGTVTAAQADFIYLRPPGVARLTAALQVSDTSTNILSILYDLNRLLPTDPIHGGGSALASITFTDPTPALSMTSADLLAYNSILQTITNTSWALTVSSDPVAVSDVLGLDPSVTAHLTAGLSVSDTSSAVYGSLDPLAALGNGVIQTIALSDGSPAMSITASQLVSDSALLAKISTAYTLTVASGAISAGQLMLLPGVVKTDLSGGVNLLDSGANIDTNLDWLETNSSLLGTTITLTDGSVPTLNMTAAQLFTDASVLQKISVSSYQIAVTAGALTAAQAAAVEADGLNTHLTGTVGVTDTTANVMTNLDAVQTLVGGSHLGTLTVTTAPALLNVTAAQASSDAGAISALLGATGANPNEVLYVQGTSGGDSVDATQFVKATNISLGSNTATMAFSGGAATISNTPDTVTLGTQTSTVNYTVGSGTEVINGFQFGTDVLNIALGADSASAIQASDITVGGTNAILIADSNYPTMGVVLMNPGVLAAAVNTDHTFAAGSNVLFS